MYKLYKRESFHFKNEIFKLKKSEQIVSSVIRRCRYPSDSGDDGVAL